MQDQSSDDYYYLIVLDDDGFGLTFHFDGAPCSDGELDGTSSISGEWLLLHVEKAPGAGCVDPRKVGVVKFRISDGGTRLYTADPDGLVLVRSRS
jgi:hypothetical protein